MPLDFDRVPGLSVRDHGQTVLSGALAALDRTLDDLFLQLAAGFGAQEYRFPPQVAAQLLERIDYFRSFPHLATFPVALDKDPGNLRAFAHDGCCDGQVRLTRLAAVRSVLTPAACYHVYGELAGRELAAAEFVTTRSTCFRHEDTYAPLQRQWAFSMREVVCLGTAAQVNGFLEQAHTVALRLARSCGLDVDWQAATDPFFDPQADPRFLMQKLEPIKRELIFEDGLAIASVNFHRDFFGEAFDITLNGEPAFSGCLAFGVERWIYALLAQHGPDPENWSCLEAARG